MGDHYEYTSQLIVEGGGRGDFFDALREHCANSKFAAMRAHWLLVAVYCFVIVAVDGRTQEEKQAMQKAIRMKTSRQLKEMMTELGVDHKKTKSIDDLRKLAYKEDVVTRW